MTDAPDPDLQARARAAFERTISDATTTDAPVDPEQLARLERAMQAMSRRTREIFLAHRLDGYSYTKVAEMTGLSVTQVERHIAKAIYAICRSDREDEPSVRRRWWHRLFARWRR